MYAFLDNEYEVIEKIITQTPQLYSASLIHDSSVMLQRLTKLRNEYKKWNKNHTKSLHLWLELFYKVIDKQKQKEI